MSEISLGDLSNENVSDSSQAQSSLDMYKNFSDAVINSENEQVDNNKETPDQIFESYGIKVEFPKMFGKTELPVSIVNFIDVFMRIGTKNKFTEELKSKYKEIIAKELIVFPRDFFKNNKVTNFKVGSLVGAGGIFHTLTGEVIFTPESLVYNGLRHNVVQHELFHRLEYRTKSGQEFRKNWDILFPRLSKLRVIFSKLASRSISAKFQEYSGMQGYKNRKISIDDPNFANAYSTAKPNEDRASTAEAVMSDPSFYSRYLEFQPHTKGDKFSMIMNFYCQLSGGKMDKRFWADFAEGKVNSNYWKNR